MKSACAILPVVLVCLAVGVTGCGKKEAPAPPIVVAKDKPAPVILPPKVDPEPPKPAPKVEDIGTVKFEFDIPVDPKATITVAGNDYTLKELEQDIKLKPGTHQIAVKQSGLDFDPQEFAVESGKRKVVRVYEPERRAAEWTIKVGGTVHVVNDGGQVSANKLEDLPSKPFRVTFVKANYRPQVTDAGLENLQGLKHVAVLLLWGDPLTDAGVERIKRLLPKLRILQLAGINEAGLKYVEGLTGLQSLSIDRSSSFTDAGLRHLRGLSGLQALSVEQTKVTGAGLAHLAGLTELHELYLNGTAVDDAGLEHLKGMKKLGIVHLGNTAVTGTGFRSLKGHESLHTLPLRDGGKVTDAGLEQIAGLPKLRALDVNGSKAITDAGLKHLKDLKSLEDLGLANTSITDTGLAYLQGLSKLQSINVRGAKVTDAGIAELKKALPKCTVQD